LHNSRSQNKREFLETTTTKWISVKKNARIEMLVEERPFQGRETVSSCLQRFSAGGKLWPGLKPTIEERFSAALKSRSTTGETQGRLYLG
jgi:hypothetical protein